MFPDGTPDGQGEKAIRNRVTEGDEPVQNVIDPTEELEQQIPVAQGKLSCYLLIVV